MSSKQASRAGGNRTFALLAAVFVVVPVAAAPRCDQHKYFEGCPVERVALYDVLVERCPAVDPNFEHALEALKQRRGGDQTSDDKDLLELRKSPEYPGALKEAEDWFSGLAPASKKDVCTDASLPE